MLEIVFDEKGGNEFLGEKYPEISVPSVESKNFSSFRALAKDIVEKNSAHRVIIIQTMPDAEAMNLLALALGVETYNEQTYLENVVFKVGDCLSAIENYKFFTALANSVRYARDLLRLDKNEQWADIKRLGYLGLRVNEDYINHQLKIVWAGAEPCRKFVATGDLSALVLVGMMKTFAICKEKFAVQGVIGTAEEAGAEVISEPKNEDELIEQIIKYVRINKHGN